MSKDNHSNKELKRKTRPLGKPFACGQLDVIAAAELDHVREDT